MPVGNLISNLPVLSFAVAVVVLWRKQQREFPLFLSYILYSLVATLLRKAIIQDAFFRFWTYWITEALYGILALAVVREAFRRVFGPAYAAYRSFRLLVPTAVVLILIISLWEMAYHPLGHNPLVVSAIYWFDFGVHLLEGIILLVLVALTAVFPVSWRRYEFGILTGFGINASITLLAYLFRFEWGSRYEAFFRYGPPIAYVLATLIWLHAFIVPPENPPRAQMGLDEMLGIMRRSREWLEWIKRVFGFRRQPLAPPV